MAPGTKGAKCGHVLSLCLYSVAVAVAVASWRNSRRRAPRFGTVQCGRYLPA